MCDQKLTYGIPNEKEITSASGRMVQTIPNRITFQLNNFFFKALPKEIATKACPKADAIF